MSSNKKRELIQTKVALVCLKTHQNNNCITNQALLKTFSKFGSILKILIFERGPLLTKVFIEYEEVDCVDEAIKSLNNTKIFNSISCNVYHSRLQYLKLDNIPYTKGVDLSTPKLEETPQIMQKQPEDLKSEWEDFHFDNNSTEDLSDEDEFKQDFSEEKLLDIRNKLNQIDDEISQTIENKLGNALQKLQQNTKCIQVTLDYGIVLDFQHVIQIFTIFGQISYIKHQTNQVYVRYKCDQDCQRAYQALKNHLNISILFNFESIPGTIFQPDLEQIHKINTLPLNFIIDGSQLYDLQQITNQCIIKRTTQQNQFSIEFRSIQDCIFTIARLRNLHKCILSSAQ